jgi:hypothetical protein
MRIYELKRKRKKRKGARCSRGDEWRGRRKEGN